MRADCSNRVHSSRKCSASTFMLALTALRQHITCSDMRIDGTTKRSGTQHPALLQQQQTQETKEKMSMVAAYRHSTHCQEATRIAVITASRRRRRES